MIKFLDLKGITDKYADEIQQAVQGVISSGWYLQGKANAAFEEHYAEYIGTRYCVGVANGLDALTLTYRAYMEMGIMHEGDEVIVPANTYIASILAITENGLKPVLVEPDINTLEMDDSLIEQHITSRTRSMMTVHLYGRCAYTERIGQLCKKYNLKLVEDNAQAHGCQYMGKKTGSLGDAAGHRRAIANYGSARKYVFKYKGRNSRLDEIQAAILDVKLRHLDADNRHRQQIAHYYYEHLSHPLISMPRLLDDAQNVYHIFPILCAERDRLQQHLKEQGIQTLIHYPVPPHRQECYKEWASLHLPITEQIHNQELSLPVSPTLTIQEVQEIVQQINSFL